MIFDLENEDDDGNETGNTVIPPVRIKVEEDKQNSDAVLIEDDEEDIDPKDVWRLGFPYKEQHIFLRPATVSKLTKAYRWRRGMLPYSY